MLFYLTNKNPDLACPALLHSNLDFVFYNDKDTGATQAAVELTKIDDLVSFMSACRIGNEWFTGITIEGNNITINEGHKYEQT